MAIIARAIERIRRDCGKWGDNASMIDLKKTIPMELYDRHGGDEADGVSALVSPRPRVQFISIPRRRFEWCVGPRVMERG
jgi:hypothetical protein